MANQITKQDVHDQMVTDLYNGTVAHLNELVANIQAAPHATGGVVGALITTLQNDLLLMRNASYLKLVEEPEVCNG